MRREGNDAGDGWSYPRGGGEVAEGFLEEEVRVTAESPGESDHWSSGHCGVEG